LAELGAAEKPVLYVFSKMDALSDSDLHSFRERIRNLLPNSVLVSSLADDGLEPLRRALLASVRKNTALAEIRLPASEGRLLAEIYRDAKVISQKSEDGQLVLSARLDPSLLERLKRAGTTVSVQGSNSNAGSET